MNIYRVFVDGIFHRNEWFLEALGRIAPEQITDIRVRAIYRILQHEYFDSGLMPNRTLFPDMVSRRFSEKVARQLTEFLLSVESMAPEYTDWRHALVEMLYEAKLEQVRGNIARGLEQLTQRKLEGIAETLTSGLDSFDNAGSSEGDARSSADALLARYQEPLLPGIRTGIPEIDTLTGGGRPGQLWIWAAYTGEAKTRSLLEIAYYMVCEGRNVVWITLEMEREEMEELFVVRHAHRFKRGGIDAKEVEMRCLSAQDYEVLRVAAMDWKQNPDYGRLYIWKPHRNATLNTVETKMMTLRNVVKPEVLVLDYLEILGTTKKRDQYRLEVKEKTQRMKRLASDLNLFALTAHQISRQGREGAGKRGYYVLSDLGESSGVEQNASHVAWSLRTEDMEDANIIRFGLMKNRHGGRLYAGVDVTEDLAHGRIQFEADSRPASV